MAKEKVFYVYNPENYEYQYSTVENPQVKNSTDKKLPALNDSETAVFDEGSKDWKIEKDYRFTHKMFKDNKIYNIEEIGEIPEGYTLITNEDAEVVEKQIAENEMKMTALDFINVLKVSGFTDEQIEEYLNSNLEIKHQLQYCQNVYYGVVKHLLPITFEDITITDEIVKQAFIEKNTRK